MRTELKIELNEWFTENMENLGEKTPENKRRKFRWKMEDIKPFMGIEGLHITGVASLSSGEEIGVIEATIPVNMAMIREYLRLKANEVLGLVKATEGME